MSGDRAVRFIDVPISCWRRSTSATEAPPERIYLSPLARSSIFIPLPSMDVPPSDPEKSPAPEKDIETLAVRTVAFPEDDLHRDEKLRPAGVEMRRQLTQEEIRLAAAGYEHLEKNKSAEDDSKFGNVNITEHSLPIGEIEGLFRTSFNWDDPAQSRGLATDDAEARLQRDGPNALTPPKKKSALQKVCIHTPKTLLIWLSEYSIVHRLSQVHVQHYSDHFWSS